MGLDASPHSAVAEGRDSGRGLQRFCIRLRNRPDYRAGPHSRNPAPRGASRAGRMVRESREERHGAHPIRTGFPASCVLRRSAPTGTSGTDLREHVEARAAQIAGRESRISGRSSRPPSGSSWRRSTQHAYKRDGGRPPHPASAPATRRTPSSSSPICAAVGAGQRPPRARHGGAPRRGGAGVRLAKRVERGHEFGAAREARA